MTAVQPDTDQWVDVNVTITEWWVQEKEFHSFIDTIGVRTNGKTRDQIISEAVNEAEYGLVYHPCQPAGDVVRMSLNTTTSTITTTTKEN